jgi:hypothetical protein
VSKGNRGKKKLESQNVARKTPSVCEQCQTKLQTSGFTGKSSPVCELAGKSQNRLSRELQEGKFPEKTTFETRILHFTRTQGDQTSL